MPSDPSTASLWPPLAYRFPRWASRLAVQGLGSDSATAGLLVQGPNDTSAPTATTAVTGEYRVSELDQNKNGPHDLQQVEGAGQGTLWKESCGQPTTLISKVQVIDMVQGTRTLPPTHSTPPWCQRRARERWYFRGVFAFARTAAFCLLQLPERGWMT